MIMMVVADVTSDDDVLCIRTCMHLPESRIYALYDDLMMTVY